MIKISKQAKQILDKLTEGLNSPGDHRKIDNAPGFMAVHIENIGACDQGSLYSVAHYYLQEGDLMKDPDMVFLKDSNGDYYPTEFQQDNLGLYQCAVEMEDGKISSYNEKLQRDLASFTSTWMRNIQEQQELSKDPGLSRSGY